MKKGISNVNTKEGEGVTNVDVKKDKTTEEGGQTLSGRGVKAINFKDLQEKRECKCYNRNKVHKRQK